MANDNHHVIAVAGPAELAKMAAERLIARISANAGRTAICLTGGSSPKQLYELLATDAYRSRIPWDHVHWFIGDDRFVARSEEHTSELQSHLNLVCRLLLEKKK